MKADLPLNLKNQEEDFILPKEIYNRIIPKKS